MLDLWNIFTSSGHSQSKAESDPEFKNGAGDQAHPEEHDEGTQEGNKIIDLCLACR